MPFNPKQSGPDPKVVEAITRLGRVQLSPLEEVMFQSWATANQIEDPNSTETPMDFRQIYQQTGGKVLPPGQLREQATRQADIQTLMKAQEAHDASSPIKMMMESQGGGQQASPDMGMSDMGGAPPAGLTSGGGSGMMGS